MGCVPGLKRTQILGRCGKETGREVTERFYVTRDGETDYVSRSFLNLSLRSSLRLALLLHSTCFIVSASGPGGSRVLVLVMLSSRLCASSSKCEFLVCLLLHCLIVEHY